MEKGAAHRARSLAFGFRAWGRFRAYIGPFRISGYELPLRALMCLHVMHQLTARTVEQQKNKVVKLSSAVMRLRGTSSCYRAPALDGAVVTTGDDDDDDGDAADDVEDGDGDDDDSDDGNDVDDDDDVDHDDGGVQGGTSYERILLSLFVTGRLVSFTSATTTNSPEMVLNLKHSRNPAPSTEAAKPEPRNLGLAYFLTCCLSWSVDERLRAQAVRLRVCIENPPGVECWQGSWVDASASERASDFYVFVVA